MNMNVTGRRCAAVLGFSLIAVAASAWAPQALSLKINGKTARQSPIVVRGKTFVALEALREAGIAVSQSGGTVSITTGQSAPGGTLQQGAVEGKAGEWLHNGIWRFRVLGVERADPAKDGPGWLAKVEIRNSSKLGGVSPAGTGWQGITIVLADGNSVAARSDAVDLRDAPLAQGASNAQTIYFETESASMPVKLILRFDPKGLAGTPPSLRFTVPDPSFRVNIQEIVRPNC